MNINTTTILNITVLLFILIARWIFELQKFEFDPLSATLLFVAIGISFIPFVSDINIFSVLKIKKLGNEIKEVKTVLYKGKVVRNMKNDLEVYIDKTGYYHEFPDVKTRDFFVSEEGIIDIEYNDFKHFKEGNKFDSVLSSKIVTWDGAGGHIFILMNNMKYHIPSASFLVDWERNDIPEIISTDDIQKFETGK
jgi:hypothetical protein